MPLPGIISYFELWSLVHVDDIDTLCQTLHALGVYDVNEGNTQDQFYDLFCKWKEEHPEWDQLLAFTVLVEHAELGKVWTDLQGNFLIRLTNDLKFNVNNSFSFKMCYFF